MASTPHLLLYLRRIIALSNTLSPPLITPVTTTLLQTLTALNTSTTYYPSPLRPVALANALAHSSSLRMELLSSNDQQDSHELWVMIKTAVEEDALKVEQEFKKKNEGGLAEILSIGLGLGVGGDKKDGKKSVRDPFTHLMSQKVTCMICKYTRDVRHIVEDHVGVIVPPLVSLDTVRTWYLTNSTSVQAACTLEDLLQEYTKMELLSEYTCRRCSLSATHEKLLAQRDRLALPSSTSTPPLSTSSSTNTITTESPFVIPPSPPNPTMTQSRKDRKKKVQKLVDRVKNVIDTGDFEKELGSDIKVEKVAGPAGKQLRFARVSANSVAPFSFRESTNSSFIYQAPNILTFHLRRSDYYGRHGAIKNLCRVVFPEYLDLTSYSDYPNSSCASFSSTSNADSTTSIPNRDIYRLSSLVVHYGSHSFGHYVAFRRSPQSSSSTTFPSSPSSSIDASTPITTIPTSDTDSLLCSEPSTPPSVPIREKPEWYRVSDENVQPSTLAEVLHGNPFLIFYERVGGELGDMGSDVGAGVGESIRKLGRGARGIVPRLVESWRLDKTPLDILGKVGGCEVSLEEVVPTAFDKVEKVEKVETEY